MKRIFNCYILIFLTVFMVGCEQTGYIVIIKTNHIRYDDLQRIGRKLEDEKYEIMIWETKKEMQKYPDEVFTLFGKKLSDKPYYFVDVYLNYVKDLTNNIARSLEINVHNVYKGMTITELKNEIDKTGDLVYRELVAKVGKENVIIERKETQRRVIFF